MATLVFLLAVFYALRSLVSLVLWRRDHLHKLLSEHFKQAKTERRKQMQILAFRKRSRERKAMEAKTRANSDAAADDTASKAA